MTQLFTKTNIGTPRKPVIRYTPNIGQQYMQLIAASAKFTDKEMTDLAVGNPVTDAVRGRVYRVVKAAKNAAHAEALAEPA
jgi:hypothetical protein